MTDEIVSTSIAAFVVCFCIGFLLDPIVSPRIVCQTGEPGHVLVLTGDKCLLVDWECAAWRWSDIDQMFPDRSSRAQIHVGFKQAVSFTHGRRLRKRFFYTLDFGRAVTGWRPARQAFYEARDRALRSPTLG